MNNKQLNKEIREEELMSVKLALEQEKKLGKCLQESLKSYDNEEIDKVKENLSSALTIAQSNKCTSWNKKICVRSCATKAIDEALSSLEDNKGNTRELIKKAINKAEFKGFHAKIDAVKEQNDQWIIEGYASVKREDRDGEVVLPEALDLSDYNGAILYNHGEDPEVGKNVVGKVLDYRIDDRGLWIRAAITKVHKYGRRIWRMIKDKILNSFSIGAPERWIKRDGNVITYWPVAEISVVSVPSNPSATFAIAKGLKALGKLESPEPTKQIDGWVGWDADQYIKNDGHEKVKLKEKLGDIEKNLRELVEGNKEYEVNNNGRN